MRTLDEVPATSRHFTTARLTSAVTLLSGRSTSEITEEQIRDAARRVEALPPTEPRVLQIRALVLGSAMDWLEDNEASTNHILGFPFTEHGLRLGVEASLRGLARVAPTQRTATRWWTWPTGCGRPARSDRRDARAARRPLQHDPGSPTAFCALLRTAGQTVKTDPM